MMDERAYPHPRMVRSSFGPCERKSGLARSLARARAKGESREEQLSGPDPEAACTCSLVRTKCPDTNPIKK
ncbi:hypothetical protein QJS04_geneDACA021627 [Acorus gramineus]|uniref:Uncharacterized protein n=1 Tax=Acorus gramineus TaxID=55184 RepID=A0AAV9ADC6_ACOGR|nr:hypothetical protein QJS04_geneDACA021627 [Acorus gramineus]